ncbi:MAG: OmpW family protein [Chitinophagaceae bacterium]|nr:OmpW family protein [Chitinophagaceae bacterium]
MKKTCFILLMLATSFAVFAQDNKPADPKWKMRFRALGAFPPSSSYDLAGDDIKISPAVTPELDFTYFFSKNFAAELILGTTHHTVKLDDNGTKTTLGKVWLLPPTVNLQYHFAGKNFTPYIGTGLNFSLFYGAKEEALDLGYKNKLGFSTQAGFDYQLNDKWFLNVDLKKIFVKTDVTIKGSVPVVLEDVKVNPFIIGLGAGFKF